MEYPPRITRAAELLDRYCEQTGLTGTKPVRRYLWSDAFAVIALLELKTLTGRDYFGDLALQLVEQVHWVLGRHRFDDPRTGWLSGLDETAGLDHPTLGGLRIGKPRPERRPAEPYDPQGEWDRDGQYFHYLTKWIQALHRVFQKTGEDRYRIWALELAKAAHAGFTDRPEEGGPIRMFWKMSIDLSRPLVPAMGQHDPLDGYITYLQLQNDPAELGGEITEMEALCRGMEWTVDDPLGLGGLLCDSVRLCRLQLDRTANLRALLEDLLNAAADGLDRYDQQQHLALPPHYRLAFRELGLALGLQGIPAIAAWLQDKPERFQPVENLEPLLQRLSRYRDWAAIIEDFWLEQERRTSPSWIEHADINTAMLAASLVPGGFLQT